MRFWSFLSSRLVPFFSSEKGTFPHRERVQHEAESAGREQGHPQTVKVGEFLGKYKIIREIGRSPTSTVYLGRHRKLRFPVAVKVLRQEALEGCPGLLEQLRSEAILLAQMNHPNIVRLWDLEDECPQCYLVMEYVAGGTLADLIRKKDSIPSRLAFAIIRQAAKGLAEAHKYGIVHRDVKPGNILLGRNGYVKVSDLGLARVYSEEQKHRTERIKNSVPTGTAAYLAPEQALDPDAADFRADIYALGATLYHALTGNMPFGGRSSMEVIMKHLKLAPTSPCEYVPELSEEATSVVLRMLAKNPDDRFSSYKQLQIALSAAVAEEGELQPVTETFFDLASPAAE